jgi:hypothetical protein
MSDHVTNTKPAAPELYWSERRAVVVQSTPLLYDAGASIQDDRPAHVRAGSGLAWCTWNEQPHLVVVQDDSNFVALINPQDPHALAVHAVPLPRGHRGQRQFDKQRNNKMFKLDLEAVATLPVDGGTRAVCFGSGSAPGRNNLVFVDLSDASATTTSMRDATPWYAALRALFAPAQLNIEGVALVDNNMLRVFQRGNGTQGRDGFVDVSWPLLLAHVMHGATVPAMTSPVYVDLGVIHNVQLTWTDAASKDGEIAFVAAAEASPNAIDDGEVVGAALGLWRGQRIEMISIVDSEQQPWLGKPEGIAYARHAPHHHWLVTDADDPQAPAQLLLVHVR